MKKFIKKHWLDLIVITALAGLFVALAFVVAVKFNFDVRWPKFATYVFDNGGYKTLLTGMRNTAIIAVSGLLIGILIGTVIAVIKVIPTKNRIVEYAQKFCSFYVAVFRGTPIVVQLLVGYYILRPLLGLEIDKLTSCVIVFGMNSGAYISEIMRGGINSVDSGQLEAARAVGMPFSVSMLKIVVPQAIKNILPTLGNEFITLIKETAVVGYVGAVDITYFFQEMGSNNYEFMIPFLVMAALYIVIVAAIAGLIKLMERRLAKSERRS